MVKRPTDKVAHAHKKQKTLTHKHKSHHGEDSLRVRSLESKGTTRLIGEHAPARIQCPKSMRELYRASLGDKGEDYHSLKMIDLSDLDILTRQSSLLQNQHYMMALVDYVHDAGRVITVMDNKMAGLCKEVEELKSKRTHSRSYPRTSTFRWRRSNRLTTPYLLRTRMSFSFFC
ncbi:hypothetical protein BHE74_00028168 [Ensete ventricosum]|nr:hypothetical protein BHE74_00028168 [Ensete ventricosum]